MPLNGTRLNPRGSKAAKMASTTKRGAVTSLFAAAAATFSDSDESSVNVISPFSTLDCFKALILSNFLDISSSSCIAVSIAVDGNVPPPFRLDGRPERRERDAEFSSDVSPPNRPPSRLPRDRALRAGEHKPIVLRWTLLRRPLMAGRSI